MYLHKVHRDLGIVRVDNKRQLISVGVVFWERQRECNTTVQFSWENIVSVPHTDDRRVGFTESASNAMAATKRRRHGLLNKTS